MTFESFVGLFCCPKSLSLLRSLPLQSLQWVPDSRLDWFSVPQILEEVSLEKLDSDFGTAESMAIWGSPKSDAWLYRGSLFSLVDVMLSSPKRYSIQVWRAEERNLSATSNWRKMSLSLSFSFPLYLENSILCLTWPVWKTFDLSVWSKFCRKCL